MKIFCDRVLKKKVHYGILCTKRNTINRIKKRRNMKRLDHEEIVIIGDSLVRLHKVLSEADQLKAQNVHHNYGKKGKITPVIIIDFTNVTSVQEDFMRGGTIIIESKQAVIVSEPIEDVVDAWLEVKANMATPNRIN
jgi:hypothetical protein